MVFCLTWISDMMEPPWSSCAEGGGFFYSSWCCACRFEAARLFRGIDLKKESIKENPLGLQEITGDLNV